MDEKIAGGVPSSSPGERVNDDEVVDRSVWLRPNCFKVDTAGKVRVSTNAFADRSQRPSFYRRILTENPPFSHPPRMNADDAVVSLLAGAIRQQSPIVHISGSGRASSETFYIIDIEPDTSDGQHISHAVVFATPPYQNSRPFDKLKERLVNLVEDWAIPPDEEFIKEQVLSR